MLARGKASSRAALASTLAVSTDEQPTVEGGFTQSLYQNTNRFNPNGDFPASGINNREVEWIEPDSLDVEVSGLVNAIASSQNSKKCYRTSTSSGYSSHSPPLSATSYTCCVSVIPQQQGAVAASTTNPFKEQGPGLAVIHEGKTIPSPIWPSLDDNSKNIHYGACVERNGEMKGAIPCCCYGYAFPHPYCQWDREQTSGTVAREVLMELSRTLNSVLEGDTGMTPAEVLRDISRTINQSIDLDKKTSLEDYIYRNSSSSSGVKDSFPTEMNPINSRVYSKNENYLGMQNSSWMHCHCEKNFVSQDLLATPFVDQNNSLIDGSSGSGDKKRKDANPEILLVPENRGFFSKNIHSYSKKNFHKNCSCHGFNNSNGVTKAKEPGKDSSQLNTDRDKFDLKKEYPHVSHGYSMLNYGEEGTSSEGNSRLSSKDSWCRESGIFEKSLNFTLDGSRAERLRRTIEEAKRRRQWCRVIITLFGIIFFILSVVIVSLSVTKGRKVFGSM
ncbi:uncharacterized protein LOC127291204 isoform X2 [Leptopilina boulardi]|uniref:uncharacterized protein LOC127291204 isoform X2 n=1 Tax=Leptopilina boulardi TaxID=63433 RepID=UPI0021F553B0|nr:uncharacterized protein LOC127291204 isoform X2 [Leptopilina boulardi]